MRLLRSRARRCLIAASLTALGCRAATRPPEPPTALPRSPSVAFISRLGVDTVSVEYASVSADTMRGAVIRRDPQLARVDYRLVRATRGGFGEVEVTRRVWRDGTWAPALPVQLRAIGDSVEIRSEAGRRMVPAPSPTLSVLGSGALLSFAVSEFLRLGVDSAALPFIAPVGGIGGRFIARRRDERVEYRLSGGFAVARLRRDGWLEYADASASTLKERITAAKLDLKRFRAIELDWTARDVGGPLSPRDTLRARIGDLTLEVDYGRPSVRGRPVFASGVLGDTIWRAGANGATHLTLSAAARIGHAEIPAGRYTLFVYAVGDQAALIINRRVGIWGTQYDAREDLQRIPLTVALRQPHTERFTIAVVDGPRGTVLSLAWADRKWTIAIAPVRIP